MDASSTVLLICLAFAAVSCSVVRREATATENVDASDGTAISVDQQSSDQLGVSTSGEETVYEDAQAVTGSEGSPADWQMSFPLDDSSSNTASTVPAISEGFRISDSTGALSTDEQGSVGGTASWAGLTNDPEFTFVDGEVSSVSGKASSAMPVDNVHWEESTGSTSGNTASTMPAVVEGFRISDSTDGSSTNDQGSLGETASSAGLSSNPEFTSANWQVSSESGIASSAMPVDNVHWEESTGGTWGTVNSALSGLASDGSSLSSAQRPASGSGLSTDTDFISGGQQMVSGSGTNPVYTKHLQETTGAKVANNQRIAGTWPFSPEIQSSRQFTSGMGQVDKAFTSLVENGGLGASEGSSGVGVNSARSGELPVSPSDGSFQFISGTSQETTGGKKMAINEEIAGGTWKVPSSPGIQNNQHFTSEERRVHYKTDKAVPVGNVRWETSDASTGVGINSAHSGGWKVPSSDHSFFQDSTQNLNSSPWKKEATEFSGNRPGVSRSHGDTIFNTHSQGTDRETTSNHRVTDIQNFGNGREFSRNVDRDWTQSGRRVPFGNVDASATHLDFKAGQSNLHQPSFYQIPQFASQGNPSLGRVTNMWTAYGNRQMRPITGLYPTTRFFLGGQEHFRGSTWN